MSNNLCSQNRQIIIDHKLGFKGFNSILAKKAFQADIGPEFILSGSFFQSHDDSSKALTLVEVGIECFKKQQGLHRFYGACNITAQEVEIITSVSLQGNVLHRKSFVSVPSKTN